MGFWDVLRGKRAQTSDSPAEQPIAPGDYGPGRLWKRVLVPALDCPFSLRSVEVATRLAGATKGSVNLAYFVEVPRAFALDAAIPESEIAASEALEQARNSAAALQVPTDISVHRTRSARDAILKLIVDENIDILILGGRADSARGLPVELIRELFDRAPCEVALDYIPAGK